MLIYDSFI